MPTPPPAEVLDLFAVPDAVEPLPGGRSRVVAGDLVLSPGRDPEVQAWLSPLVARLAVRLDERPDREPHDLRLAVPVPARDGSWVVDGWAACRWEPGTAVVTHPALTLAAGRLLHARLAAEVAQAPPAVTGRGGRWAAAERLVHGPRATLDAAVETVAPARRDLLARAAALLDEPVSGADQLVHVDLAGSVLVDPAGAPVVLDVVPAWRAPRWAEAVAEVDLAAPPGGDRRRLARRGDGADRQALLRAALLRAIGSRPGDEVGPAGWDDVLADVIAVTEPGGQGPAQGPGVPST